MYKPSQQTHITALFAIAITYWLVGEEKRAIDTIHMAVLFSQSNTLMVA